MLGAAPKNRLLLLAGMGFLTGCSITGNPREGGIFWSENKASDRLYQRRVALNETHADLEARRREGNQLKRQRDDLASTVTQQKHELETLRQEIAVLRQSGPGDVATSEADLRRLEEERRNLASSSDLGSGETERELSHLRKEVEKLKEIKRLRMQTR